MTSLPLAATLTRALNAAGVSRAGVAVSGGSDSLALLALAHESQVALCAATVDHGLRPAAKDEAAHVAAICQTMGLRHDILTWENPQAQGNVMAAARTARYDLLAQWARQVGCDAVLLGHTSDDLAETFVMRLGRKAGVEGLAAMPERFSRGGVTFLRPFLSVSRASLQSELTARGLTWISDPSNEDPRYERARIRSALGALDDLGVGRGELAAVAEHLRAARMALGWATARAAETLVRQDRGDLLVTRKGLHECPEEIAFRILGGALQWVSGTPYRARGASVLRVLDDKGDATLNGCLITGEGPYMRIAREFNALQDLRAPAPGLWDGRWLVSGPATAEITTRDEGATIAALGPEGLAQLDDWRACRLPRRSLLAAPAIWSGTSLLAAPLVAPSDKWNVTITPLRRSFAKWLEGV